MTKDEAESFEALSYDDDGDDDHDVGDDVDDHDHDDDYDSHFLGRTNDKGGGGVF